MKAVILAGLLMSGAAFAEPSIDQLDPPRAPMDDPACSTQWCSPYWKSMPKLEYVFFAAEAADTLTTLDIKNHPNLHETNFILGSHPSDAMIIGYGGVTALIHSSITYVMIDSGVDPKVIKAWEYISIGVEGAFAAHNYHLGLRFKF